MSVHTRGNVRKNAKDRANKPPPPLSIMEKKQLAAKKERVDLMKTCPEGAIGAVTGLFYKIGLHGFAYYWNVDRWIKSDKDPVLLQVAIEGNKDAFSIDKSYFQY
tara:strand:+ start:2456 stop:2770 length:315 start_codon:yes stop_codon:yes gene_type:complete